ncbi:MAG: glycosyltransferase family 2 protein [Planctomycetes bacterium]|nr:glycosyltransferase family 2 protein [Planctomycetota bacterium]
MPLLANQLLPQFPDSIRQRTDAGPIDVSVCIANWNCTDYLRACLTSLTSERQGVRVEIIVVDNASTDGAVAMMTHEFPDVTVLRNTANLGFARASNQAAALARGRYLLFLNNDTFVPPLALHKLVAYARAHPEAVMIGPRLCNGRGELQRSFRREPTIPALLHRTALLHWTRILKAAHDDYRRNQPAPAQACPVDVLMGAAVLLRRDVFERFGRWDEDFRFGVEDIELSARMRSHGPLVYLPSVEIVHYGRLSSRENVKFAAPNVLIGYVRFFRKSGTSRTLVFLFKLALTLDAPVQILGKCLQYVGRVLSRRHEKAQRTKRIIIGLWHFLRHDLGRFWRT